MRISPLSDMNPEAMLVRFVDEARQPQAPHHQNLDWPAVLDDIARRAHSAASQDLIRHFPMLCDPDLIARRLAEVGQCIALSDAGDDVIAANVTEMDEMLMKASRGAVLSGEELIQAAANLRTFSAVRRFYEVRREEAPLLWDYAQDIAVERDLEKRLTASFDAEGRLVDNASPELASLRERSRRLAESLRSRIERKLSDADVQDSLQDTYFTQREGRYVLPVKSGCRGKVDGIVHATSASGQTVFIEPAELVELNNALRITDFGIEAEEQRILQSLSGMVGARRDVFLTNTRRCLYLDTVDAVAAFAIACHCHIPDLSDGEIELYQARHPLLALRKAADPEAVLVANDILLHEPASTFVISGANAGGKTVNLKTVGLFALMTKAGIPLSAGASSCFPIYASVFADIGDDQSIAQNISTFSAHVQCLASALPEANPQALFLLDEPFSGTDPEHASPLVIALIDYLHRSGAVCFVTTHFETVKAYALEESWIASASVSFDLERMHPTYQLQIGHPGTSAAFEIAAQHGLPSEILQQARAQYASRETSCLEHAIASLEQQRVRLEEARELVAQSQAELDTARREVEELRVQMRAREAGSLGADVASIAEHIGRIRARVNKLRKKTFTAGFQHQTETQEEIDREMQTLSADLKQQSAAVADITAPPFDPLPEREIVIGKKVQIHQYRRNATVLARSGAHVTLQLGILQVHAHIKDLGRPLPDTQSPEPTARQKRIANAKLQETVIHNDDSRLLDAATQLPLMAQISDNTLDLRGLTSEDAIEKTEFFLQSMIIHEQPMAYIIHGHGTGILRTVVRQYLAKSSFVQAQRPGQYYEGGDGVTLAWLKPNA